MSEKLLNEALEEALANNDAVIKDTIKNHLMEQASIHDQIKGHKKQLQVLEDKINNIKNGDYNGIFCQGTRSTMMHTDVRATVESHYGTVYHFNED